MERCCFSTRYKGKSLEKGYFRSVTTEKLQWGVPGRRRAQSHFKMYWPSDEQKDTEKTEKAWEMVLF